jgi:hypothetical protein
VERVLGADVWGIVPGDHGRADAWSTLDQPAVGEEFPFSEPARSREGGRVIDGHGALCTPPEMLWLNNGLQTRAYRRGRAYFDAFGTRFVYERSAQAPLPPNYKTS